LAFGINDHSITGSGERDFERALFDQTINGSLSNNLFDRQLVTHLPVLQIKIRESGVRPK